MSAYLVAIDIGSTGALALFDVLGELLAVEDMPVLADGPAGRPTVNAILLADLIRRWAPKKAVVEHAFGRSRGVVEGVLGAHGLPTRFLTPAWWKRRVGIPAGSDRKDMARSLAIGRWPDKADLFARKKDHNRAEAALIGVAVFEDQFRGTFGE